MSLEQYSDLSQIIGAVAVVASLIFVGVQLRQNTKAVRAPTSQAHAVGYQQIIAGISNSGEFASIWRRGLADFQALDDDEHWHTIEQQVTDLVTQPGVQAWWKLRRHWHSASFRNWIDHLPQRAAATIYEDNSRPSSPSSA